MRDYQNAFTPAGTVAMQLSGKIIQSSCAKSLSAAAGRLTVFQNRGKETTAQFSKKMKSEQGEISGENGRTTPTCRQTWGDSA